MARALPYPESSFSIGSLVLGTVQGKLSLFLYSSSATTAIAEGAARLLSGCLLQTQAIAITSRFDHVFTVEVVGKRSGVCSMTSKTPVPKALASRLA